jgi:ubiquinone/menaquinone biosynthesis C-methylase UbiE
VKATIGLFEQLLRRWRERIARPWIPSGANVLDIGCHQGELLARLGDAIGPSVGIDPVQQQSTTTAESVVHV